MNADADAYLARFRRVLEHIEAHLEEALTVERLAGVAAFSKFHFHRQWAELFGIGVYPYVQLMRLRRASYQLAFRDRGILDIALDSGYESHEAFSRAFKKAIGQTPSEFREQPRWNLWHAAYQRLDEVRSQHMQPDHRPENVRIEECSQIRVGVLEHRGDPRSIGDSIRRFIEWRKQNGLRPSVSATFNVFWDDPEQTPPDQFRMDLCAEIKGPVEANEHGVVEKTIPGGRCAVLRHVGSDDGLGATLKYLYARWLPASGEEPRDYPLYVQRVTMFPDVPEHEAVTEVFLPLKQIGGERQAGFGCSPGCSSPWRLQPTAASQVLGCQVGGGSCGAGSGVRKPSNHGAEEQGSISRRSFGWCFLKFINT